MDIKSIFSIFVIVAIIGIFYAFNSGIFGPSNRSEYIPITIFNTQNIPTPTPFQQQIAICNGSINIGPNFAYVNNSTLFNLINNNGSNVYFATTCNSTPNIYSWYLGQLINGSTYCKIWWIKLDNGIPANSNVTIYMYIGNSSDNYYLQYYPYVGASPNVFPSRQYDNGRYVFIAYGYFNNTFDGWVYKRPMPFIATIYDIKPTATPYGIELSSTVGGGAYILPPNNWNIPKIPLIVEEVWYYTGGMNINAISLFGNTNNQQFLFAFISNLSTCSCFFPSYGGTYLMSAVTNDVLNSTEFPLLFRGTVYSYLIVNSSYAQTGYYIYSPFSFIWAPLTLLNTYTVNNNGYTHANLNYNPFQYGTLQIGAVFGAGSYQYIQWVVARAYPPNGVMPLIYI